MPHWWLCTPLVLTMIPSTVIRDAVHRRVLFLTQDHRIFLPIVRSLLNRKWPTRMTGFPLNDFPKRGSGIVIELSVLMYAKYSWDIIKRNLLWLWVTCCCVFVVGNIFLYLLSTFSPPSYLIVIVACISNI